MSTNFFENQERARKMTSRLVFLYVLAVIAIVSAVVGLVHVAFGLHESYDAYGNTIPGPGIGVYLLTAAATIGLIVGAMLFRMMQLSKGGSAVAVLLDGSRIFPNTKDPNERRLLNVVEEMAIASGVAVPPVYVLYSESSINAFAAGVTPSDAVIGVSHGAILKLSRDELQGVIAHEFSHIFNGDMKLNLRLIGVLSGITMLFTVGRIILRAGGRGRSSRSSKGGGAGAILFLGVGLIVIGAIGVFFARLIKAAVSRQREFLADASAVQYTRSPNGIGKALLKIGIDPQRAFIKSSYAEETSHLFFGQVMNFSSIFATHPSIEDRVQRINPGAFLDDSDVKKMGEPEKEIEEEPIYMPELSPEERTRQVMAGVAGAGVMLGGGQQRMIFSIGEPTADDVAAAREFLAALPEIAVEAAKTAEGAKALVLSLLLYESEAAERQKTLMVDTYGAHVVGYVEEIKRQFGALEPGARLPILEKSIPALRELSSAEVEKFIGLVKNVIKIDEKYHMFEFVVLTLLTHHLRPVHPGIAGERLLALGNVRHEVAVLASAFAHVGAADEVTAKEAFQAARRQVNALSIHIQFIDVQGCGPKQLNTALTKLRRLKPLPKRSLIEASINAILSDRKVAPEEIELLQAVSLVLDVPMPPLSSIRGRLMEQVL